METNIKGEYSESEERLNIITHGFGWLMSVVVFVFLMQKSFDFTPFWQKISFIIYGLSMIILYGASTVYHAAKKPNVRRKLKVVDHVAIYFLIAGSYTPFCLVALQSQLGWYMFIIVWSFALVGTVFKLFFTGRFEYVSTTMYVFMGWLVVFFIKSLLANLSEEGAMYLILGGVFYTVGAILYSIKKIPYNHAIFHVFVLLGSLCHFIAIYNL